MSSKTRHLTPSPPPTHRGLPFEHKELSENQLRIAFSMLDTNKDGEINPDEFRSMLNNLGIRVSDVLFNQMLNDIKESGDGQINERVFRQLMSKYSQKASKFGESKEDDLEKDLLAAFKVFDNDNNGLITRDELRSALKLIGETPNEKDLDHILSQIGCDPNGQINFRQFVQILL